MCCSLYPSVCSLHSCKVSLGPTIPGPGNSREPVTMLIVRNVSERYSVPLDRFILNYIKTFAVAGSKSNGNTSIPLNSNDCLKSSPGDLLSINIGDCTCTVAFLFFGLLATQSTLTQQAFIQSNTLHSQISGEDMKGLLGMIQLS